MFCFKVYSFILLVYWWYYPGQLDKVLCFVCVECQKDLDWISPPLPSCALCLFVFWVMYVRLLREQLASGGRMAQNLCAHESFITLLYYQLLHFRLLYRWNKKKYTIYNKCFRSHFYWKKNIFATSCLTNYFCLRYTSVQSAAFVPTIALWTDNIQYVSTQHI